MNLFAFRIPLLNLYIIINYFCFYFYLIDYSNYIYIIQFYPFMLSKIDIRQSKNIYPVWLLTKLKGDDN